MSELEFTTRVTEIGNQLDGTMWSKVAVYAGEEESLGKLVIRGPLVDALVARIEGKEKHSHLDCPLCDITIKRLEAENEKLRKKLAERDKFWKQQYDKRIDAMRAENGRLRKWESVARASLIKCQRHLAVNAITDDLEQLYIGVCAALSPEEE